MKNNKIFGIVLVVVGLFMVAGSIFGYQGEYRVMAPLTMSLIVLAGIVMINWKAVKAWLSK